MGDSIPDLNYTVTGWKHSDASLPIGTNPATLASLELWLDASDTSTITHTTNAVSQWSDKSGNGEHVVQSTAANKPSTGTSMLAGKNVVSFYGDDYLQNTTVSVSQPDLVFLVANLTDTGSSSMFMFDGKSSRQTIHIHATNQWSIFAGAEPMAGTSDDSPHLFTALFNGSSSALWLDGTSIISTNAGTASLTGISLGARGAGDLPIIGDIAEVMVVSSPSSVDRQSIEGYLAHKWGLSGSLPSNHSHKTS